MLFCLENEKHVPLQRDSPSTEWVVPPVHDVLTWMVVGICHSDPFFRLLSYSSASPSRFPCSLRDPCASSPMVAYPVSPSQWLFTWDMDRFWLSVKSKLKHIRSGSSPQRMSTELPRVADTTLEAQPKKTEGEEAERVPPLSHGHYRGSLRTRRQNVIFRPVAQIQSALLQYFFLHSPAVTSTPHSLPPSSVSSWTCFHSLYYFTCRASVSPFRTRPKEAEEVGEDARIRVFHAPSSRVSAPSGSSSCASTSLSKGGHPVRTLSSSLRKEEEVGEDVEWNVLFTTWFEQIDHNLPDLLGGSSQSSSRSSWVVGNDAEKRREARTKGEDRDCPSARHLDKEKEEENDDSAIAEKWLKEMPHVGFREVLSGPPRLRQLLSSVAYTAPGMSPPASDVGYIRYSMQLFFLHQKYVQTSAGGGFYLALQQLNERLVADLCAEFWLAPLAVSRLGAMLHWYSSSGVGDTDVSLLFREHSLLYFLLWLGGNPSVHRLQRRQVESVVAFDQMREIGMEGKRNAEGKEGVVDVVQDEFHFLRTLYYKSKVYTPPVLAEILAFFVLRAPRDESDVSLANETKRHQKPFQTKEGSHGVQPEEEREGEDRVLLHRIRGVALQTLSVVNTAYATPMEVWACLEEMVCPSSVSCSDGRETEMWSSGISTSVAVWARVEPLVWCVPYSLLKRRMAGVARGWVRHRGPSSSGMRVPTDLGSALCCSSSSSSSSPERHGSNRRKAPSPRAPRTLSRTRPSFTIREWAEALLWEREWVGGSVANRAVACEMIWSLLALADPFQEHFQLTPPSGASDTTSTSHTKVVEKSTDEQEVLQDSSCVENWVVTLLDEDE